MVFRFHHNRADKERNSNVSLLATAQQALANIDDLSKIHIEKLKDTGNENDQMYKDLVSILTLTQQANHALASMKIEDDDDDEYDAAIIKNINSKDFDNILNEIDNDVETESKTNSNTSNNKNENNDITFGQLPATTQQCIKRPVLWIVLCMSCFGQ